jgi:aspartyl-tRNA(Asn)/glutamyl-tRNA(Gln) amidotransferase subunit A
MAISASEYLTAQRARQRIREALRSTYERVDIIAAPTTARVAPLLSEGVKGNGDDGRHASYNQSNLLRFPSMLGLPGCSLPCGINSEGLPIGMQLIGALVCRSKGAECFCGLSERNRLAHPPPGNRACMKERGLSPRRLKGHEGFG